VGLLAKLLAKMSGTELMHSLKHRHMCSGWKGLVGDPVLVGSLRSWPSGPHTKSGRGTSDVVVSSKSDPES